jgi:hypothetical protein
MKQLLFEDDVQPHGGRFLVLDGLTSSALETVASSP